MTSAVRTLLHSGTILHGLVCVLDILFFLFAYVFCMVDDRHCCTDNKRCSVPLLYQMLRPCIAGW